MNQELVLGRRPRASPRRTGTTRASRSPRGRVLARATAARRSSGRSSPRAATLRPGTRSASASGTSRWSACWSDCSRRPTASPSCRSRTRASSGSASTRRSARCSDAGGALTRGDLNTGAAVGWADGVDPDGLAARIRREVAGRQRRRPGRDRAPARGVHRVLHLADGGGRGDRAADRRALAVQHGRRRDVRAHPGLRDQASPRRHRPPAPRRGASGEPGGQPGGGVAGDLLAVLAGTAIERARGAGGAAAVPLLRPARRLCRRLRRRARRDRRRSTRQPGYSGCRRPRRSGEAPENREGSTRRRRAPGSRTSRSASAPRTGASLDVLRGVDLARWRPESSWRWSAARGRASPPS